jgi:hypothetical protein
MFEKKIRAIKNEKREKYTSKEKKLHKTIQNTLELKKFAFFHTYKEKCKGKYQS